MTTEWRLSGKDFDALVDRFYQEYRAALIERIGDAYTASIDHTLSLLAFWDAVQVERGLFPPEEPLAARGLAQERRERPLAPTPGK